MTRCGPPAVLYCNRRSLLIVSYATSDAVKETIASYEALSKYCELFLLTFHVTLGHLLRMIASLTEKLCEAAPAIVFSDLSFSQASAAHCVVNSAAGSSRLQRAA